MAKRDYYEVLGVERSADETGIKKAFRRLAMEYHPDRNPSEDGIHKFREAQEAYEILIDDQKRSLYDQFGHAGLSGAGAGFGNINDVFSGFQSIFDDFFGGQREPSRGADLLFRLDLDFREAILGCKKTVKIRRSDHCSTCSGSGAEAGSRAETCGTCQGRGKVSRSQGFFVVSQTCPRCGGKGQVITKPCHSCHGSGRKAVEQEIEVQIPAGVDTGIRLRISNEGELPERGGRRGDLYVEINVHADEVFARDGSDLFARIYVPYPTAVLGGKIEAPLIEGTTEIKIPVGMKSPHRTVLKNEGAKDLKRNRRGDLVIEVHIETPPQMSARAKELIQELQTELSDKNSDKSDEGAKKGKKKKSFFKGHCF